MKKNNLIELQELELKREIIGMMYSLIVTLIFVILVKILSDKPNFSEDLISFFKFILCCSFITAISFMVVFIINFITYLYGINKIKNNKEFDKIEEELENDHKEEFLGINMILTDNYIIDASVVYKVIKYDDIIWIYEYEQIDEETKSYAIFIRTKDNKKHIIARASGKTEIEFRQVYNKILKRVPNILVGNTKENLKEYKNIIKHNIH